LQARIDIAGGQEKRTAEGQGTDGQRGANWPSHGVAQSQPRRRCQPSCGRPRAASRREGPEICEHHPGRHSRRAQDRHRGGEERHAEPEPGRQREHGPGDRAAGDHEVEVLRREVGEGLRQEHAER
jgi:hypothetical protein